MSQDGVIWLDEPGVQAPRQQLLECIGSLRGGRGVLFFSRIAVVRVTNRQVTLLCQKDDSTLYDDPPW